MSAHAEREMDVTNAGRGIWLVKVPKFMRDAWSKKDTDAEVGRLTISKIPGQKTTSISFSLNEQYCTAHALPKEHKFISHDLKQSLGVFSLPIAPDSDVVMTAIEATALASSNVALEGQVIQKFECQPLMDERYLKLKLETKKKAETPARKAIPIDRPASVYKPKTSHPHKMAIEKQKESEGKKAREDKDKVLEMLFAAFEKHQYYNIKDLQKLTKQPITYLKEILKEVCDYNVKNPHKNTWELKREYRHYKEDKPAAAAAADDSD
uniref:General transcription factor IIF subunit 2 n=1 Tax=Hirondellea gigas TaxID=1518452 RepID=A0A2P2HXT2_9CRUS